MEESFEPLKKLCSNYWKEFYKYENSDSQIDDYEYYRSLALAMAATASGFLDHATGRAYYYNLEKECMEVIDESI